MTQFGHSKPANAHVVGIVKKDTNFPQKYGKNPANAHGMGVCGISIYAQNCTKTHRCGILRSQF